MVVEAWPAQLLKNKAILHDATADGRKGNLTMMSASSSRTRRIRKSVRGQADCLHRLCGVPCRIGASMAGHGRPDGIETQVGPYVGSLHAWGRADHHDGGEGASGVPG